VSQVQNSAVASPQAGAAPARTHALLEFLPFSLFGSVMGLTGLSVAWRLAQARYGGPAWLAQVPQAIGIVAIVAFVAILAGYAVKLVTAFDAVRTEFRHPIAGNLFGTFLISLMLLPIVIAPYSLILAQALWVVGTIGMILFAWLIVSRWMSDRQQVAHATPAWIIPVVGLLDVPLALPVLGLPSMHGLVVFGLAVGLFFAVPLFTLIFSRLLFEPPMPDALKPTLLILVAPFAVGYSTYALAEGPADLFAESLYMLTLFMLAVLLGQLRHLPVCCPFRVSWWAVSFPLAASAITGLRFAAAEPGIVTDAIALLLLALATVVIAGLLVRTLVGVARGELRTLSGP
jgi:tellurite resistance protein